MDLRFKRGGGRMNNKDMKSLQIKCKDAGKDLFRYIASVEFNTPYDEVTVDQRAIAKDMFRHYLYDRKAETSEWLWVGFDEDKLKWSCRNCGRGVENQENFCPNCGARMVVEE